MLFQYGLFAGEGVEQAARVLMVSVVALPIYALSAFIVEAFHARKQMKPPFGPRSQVSSSSVFLCLFLMEEYGVIGLAWANVSSRIRPIGLFAVSIQGSPLLLYIKPSPFFALGCILSSLVMGAALFFLRSSLGLEDSRVGDIWTLCF